VPPVKKPNFITFTGPDVFTDVSEMVRLHQDYPVEFGILFSPKRQGVELRYPSPEVIERMLDQGLILAAHICGDYARSILAGKGAPEVERFLIHFSRVQINTTDPEADPSKVNDWAYQNGVMPIMQCRDYFPTDHRVAWLFDASGGRGITPGQWPAYNPSLRIGGYAGGINPDNVSSVIDTINNDPLAGRYWLDMESGVRDENDRFDLQKCRRVCELVYGVAQ
jgi:hypothetical protein